MGKKIITHSNGVVETRETFYTEETVNQLKQQIEEKNKEIERLKVFEKAYYFNQLQASQEDIQQFQQLANQSAVNINHIAITELEKVKMLIEWKFNSIIEVREYLQQQIKELKGEKDVED